MGAPMIRHGSAYSDVSYIEMGQLHGKSQLQGSFWEPKFKIPKRCVGGGECSHGDPSACSHAIVHDLFEGEHGQFPLMYNTLPLGNKTFQRLGDPNPYVLTTLPTGTFCTVNGVLAPIPPEAIQWYLTKPVPLSIVLNSRMMGKPLNGKDRVPDWEPEPPIPIAIGATNNPYTYPGGGAVEIMPHHGSRTTNQLLIFSTAKGTIYNRREQALGDRFWEEPIPMGVESHAKYAQDRWGLDNPPVQKFKSEKKTTNALEIRAGLRGGGEAYFPCYLATKAGEWNISGYHLGPQFYGKDPPTVLTWDGHLEPVFMPGTSNKRIRNGKKATALFGGSGLGGKEKDWLTVVPYCCYYCGSDDHGVLDCPINQIHITIHGSDILICMHCTQTGHILADCPYPPQFFPNRLIVRTLELYIHTLHWKQTLLVWSCETDVIPYERYDKLKEHIMSPNNGCGRHPFGLHGPCPDCNSSHHQTRINYWINQIVDEEQRWFYFTITDQQKQDGMKFSREDYEKRCNWCVDMRFCPVYWVFYHPVNGNACFVIYNPLISSALDALNRVYLRCQGWHIKTPIPIPEEHIWKRVENPEGKLVSMRPVLPPYDVAQTFEMPEEWVRSSGDAAFNDKEFQ
jgi:hypothetical protein